VTPSTLVGGDAVDLWIVALPSTVLTSVRPAAESQSIESLRREWASFRESYMKRERKMALLEQMELEDSSDEDERKSTISASSKGDSAAAAVKAGSKRASFFA